MVCHISVAVFYLTAVAAPALLDHLLLSLRHIAWEQIAESKFYADRLLLQSPTTGQHDGRLSTRKSNSGFRDKLKENLVYKIESFMVTAARGKYKILDRPYRIRITQQTKMMEVDPEPEDFALYDITQSHLISQQSMEQRGLAKPRKRILRRC